MLHTQNGVWDHTCDLTAVGLRLYQALCLIFHNVSHCEQPKNRTLYTYMGMPFINKFIIVLYLLLASCGHIIM